MTTTSIRYGSIEEFEKDLKRLLKRFKSLTGDLETAKKNAIEILHIRRIDNQSSFPIPGFCFENVIICKIKKFACKSLKGKGVKSGIRVVYAYFPNDEKVIFIEIYYKGDKGLEDKERIKLFLKNIN